MAEFTYTPSISLQARPDDTFEPDSVVLYLFEEDSDRTVEVHVFGDGTYTVLDNSGRFHHDGNFVKGF